MELELPEEEARLAGRVEAWAFQVHLLALRIQVDRSLVAEFGSNAS